MLQWMIIGLLYLVGIGFFRLVGGLGSAADGLARWGQAVSNVRRSAATSS